ncbi:MAG: DUF5686 and carboxypeptidase regulatory-like domain-containing protein, partial [Bacteroidetes bacterium]|nr:DUF5686 and carboxypeptidase regulatory-like domain-containing protein [Bacteroidota bacterium]
MGREMIWFIIVAMILSMPTREAFAQSVVGYVYSSDNTPIPYANVYVKYTTLGTTTDENGRYHLKLDEGDYEIVVGMMGFQEKSFTVILKKKQEIKNIWLEASSIDLTEIEVKAKRRDPAYEIIKSAIDARKDNQKQAHSLKCNIYAKAKEVVSEKEQKRRQKLEEQAEVEKTQTDPDLIPEDPAAKQLAEDKKKKAEEIRKAFSINMLEMQLERHYQYPDKIKDIRNAYKRHGSLEGLFLPEPGKEAFDFYDALLNIPALNEVPMISPLNPASVISYKFKLENSYYENGKKIFHILFSPRKKGNATFEGSIDIVDSTFAIRKIDISMNKGALLFYDNFRLLQEYQLYNDTIWMVSHQEYDYFTSAGKRNFQGNTTVDYSDYQLNVEFPKRYFNMEVSVTTEEAYKRDSTYWDKIRPQPLSLEEQRSTFIRDSIASLTTRKEYLDSIDAAYN